MAVAAVGQAVAVAEVGDQRDSLSRIFAALADPTRRAILHRLKRGPANVAELGAPFAMSGPAVSKHLRVLENAGLISRARIAQCPARPPGTRPVPPGTAWTEEFRAFWDERYDRLDDYLKSMPETETEQ